MRFGLTLTLAAAALTAASRAAAQEASLFLGGVHTQYADTVSGSAGTAGARLGWRSPSFAVAGEGYFTRFTSGGWATQANSGLSVFGGIGRSGAVGFRADVSHSYVQGGLWTGVGTAGPFGALALNGWLVGAGATAGGVRRIDETTDPLFTGSLRLGRVVQALAFEARVVGTSAGSVRFADFSLAAAFTTPRFTLAVTGGLRAGDLADDPWAQGRVEWRVATFATLEAAVGNYPDDVAGFLGGFFVSGGVRIGWHAPRVTTATLPAARVERVSASEVRVSFTVVNAETLAIAGEWNAWTPVPLSRVAGNRWEAILSLPPGLYRFALVKDGETWMVPDGIATMPDDFGGEVGLLLAR